jgi:hypothetical protein
MKTKTFKIGEYAIGGIIRITINDSGIIDIQALDWDTKKSIRHGVIVADSNNTFWRTIDYLEELTSFYYAEKILKWTETQIKLT